MKQPKVATVPPPAPKPVQPSGPRYRYFSTTPTTVTLRMRDLKVPEKARTATYDSEQFVDLPCEDIFGGPAPKILLSKLARLAPDCVTAESLPDQGVNVSAARLALAYVVTEKRARLEEPAPPPSISEAELDVLFGEVVPPAANKTAAPAEEKPSDEKPKIPEEKPLPVAEKPAPATAKLEAPADDKTKAEPEEKKPSLLKIQPPKSLEPLAVKSLEPKAPAGETTSLAEIQLPKEEEKKPSAKIRPVPPAPKPSEPAPAASGEQPPAGEVLKKPFGLFPMFRRKETVETKPSVAVPRSRIEIPKPRRPSSPITDAASPAVPEAPLTEPPAEEPGAMAPIAPPTPKPAEEPTLLPKAAPAAPPPAEPITAPPVAPPIPPKGMKPLQASQAIRIPSPPAPAPAAEFPPPFAASAPVPAVEPPPAPSAPQPKPAAAPVPPPPPAAEIPPPYASSGLAPAAELFEIPAPKAEIVKPAAEVPKPVPAIKEVQIPLPVSKVEPAVLVETEHLSSEKDRPEIAEQDALQAVFMTEEFLSVERVLELCGNLPGIKSCVLSIGPSVVAAHNAPDTVDVVSLSAHAQEMLKAMRASSAKMGIGAVPAVTVHSEKGPITFFHQDDLCLLVLHKDRGFIPGVREKLQQVVTELAQAKLPLPVGKKLLGS